MFRSQRPPMRRQSSAEQALARANQRLLNRGSFTKDDSSDNEDDINNYLSSLRKKTAQGPDAEVTTVSAGKKRISLGDGASDISITDSSEIRADKARAGSAKPKSKFLKSKKPAPAAAPESRPDPRTFSSAVATDSYQRSAALAKATSLAGKYAFKRASGSGGEKGRVAKPADSDSEFSMSAPSTTESSDAKLRKKKKEKGKKNKETKVKAETTPVSKQFSRSSPLSTPQALYSKSSKAKLNYLTDEESASIGKDGLKFLKKSSFEKEDGDATSGASGNLTPKTRKQLRFAGISDDEIEDDIQEMIGEKSPKTPSSHSSSSRSGRFRRTNAMSDDDMSTAELGEGLISSSSGLESPKKPALKSPDTPTSPKKRVTIAESSTFEQSVEEVHEVLDASDLSFLEENIVGKLHSSSSESEESVSEEFNRGVTEHVMDVEDLSKSEDETSSPRARLEAIQSVDDLSYSAISDEEEKKDVASISSSSSTSSTVIHSEARGASQYDSDFEASEIMTEKTRPATATTYSQDFESSTKSSSASRYDYSSDSEETTVTESYTKRVQHRRRRYRSVDDSDKSVQTYDVGLSYQWNMREAGMAHMGPAYGMGSVDLNPIAHYAVPPETLESVTAYNPCVVALNNLLRQQLDMTHDFMATQRRLYEAMSRTIVPEFSYTTLEETKKFIAKNRPPSMSMEEALREVEQEMT